MTDDLITRLREQSDRYYLRDGQFVPDKICGEAADEIERLRAGLQLVLDWYDRDGSVGGCSNLIEDDIRPLLGERVGGTEDDDDPERKQN